MIRTSVIQKPSQFIGGITFLAALPEQRPWIVARCRHVFADETADSRVRGFHIDQGNGCRTVSGGLT